MQPSKEIPIHVPRNIDIDLQGGNFDTVLWKEAPLRVHDRPSPHGVTVQEAVWYIMDLKRRERMTDEHFDTFLKVLKMLLGGENCNLPGSLWHMRRALGAETVWDYVIHVCPKYHRNFPWKNGEAKRPKQETCGVAIEFDDAGNATEWCQEERYKVIRTARGPVMRPREYYFYFTVKRLVKRWMRNTEYARLRAGITARSPENACVMSSPHARRINDHPMVAGNLLRETLSKDGSKPGYVRAGMSLEYGEDDGKAKKHDKSYALYTCNPTANCKKKPPYSKLFSDECLWLICLHLGWIMQC